jgi:hypothetical protein
LEGARGQYEGRAVHPAAQADGDVEIAHGLRAGEPVVVEGTFVLKSEVLREQMGHND